MAADGDEEQFVIEDPEVAQAQAIIEDTKKKEARAVGMAKSLLLPETLLSLHMLNQVLPCMTKLVTLLQTPGAIVFEGQRWYDQCDQETADVFSNITAEQQMPFIGRSSKDTICNE
jgi:hypothetical protein